MRPRKHAKQNTRCCGRRAHAGAEMAVSTPSTMDMDSADKHTKICAKSDTIFDSHFRFLFWCGVRRTRHEFCVFFFFFRRQTASRKQKRRTFVVCTGHTRTHKDQPSNSIKSFAKEVQFPVEKRCRLRVYVCGLCAPQRRYTTASNTRTMRAHIHNCV